MISDESAKSKALAHAGIKADQVTFTKIDLEWEDGQRIYEVEFYTKDGREYDYEIDAYTGVILDFDYDAESYTPSSTSPNTGSSYIGEAKARSIALAKIPGASERNVAELKLDYDDGRWQYEGEIIFGSFEYEFEIDAFTGKILSWERESRWD